MRFTLAQRNSVERYPPTLHQTALLQSLGSVVVIDAPPRGEDSATQTAACVRRIRIDAVGKGLRDTQLSRIGSAARFAHEYRRQLKGATDVAIAYEPDAAALLLRGSGARNVMRVVHLHEIPDAELYSSSFVSSIAIRYMIATLERADLVIVPDSDRAVYTAQVAKLTRPPVVVMNCPLTLEQLPESKLLPWLEERGVYDSGIVHFQGSLGPDHGLAQVIASMHFWPSDSVFVIVGDGPLEYMEVLRALAGREGVAARVLFVGRVSYADVFAFAAGATVGVTLLEPTNANWKFAAGASNKRFEYAAMGIPQVSNIGAGMDALFGITGIAELVDANDVEAIGRAIAKLLCNRSHAVAVGENARRLHLRSYNYEQQFAPVLEELRQWEYVAGRAAKP
jgi:glycosyltransferase involved in cell wall biosynthesis